MISIKKISVIQISRIHIDKPGQIPYFAGQLHQVPESFYYRVKWEVGEYLANPYTIPTLPPQR